MVHFLDSDRKIKLPLQGAINEISERGRIFARDSNAPFNKNKRFDQFDQEREQRSYGSPLQRLQNLESEDSYDVLQALSSSNLGLLAMYQQNKISDNQVEMMITVLEKACQCKHSPQRLSKLLQAMNDSGFLSGPVVQYITGTASSLKQSPISAEVVVSLVEILKVLMHHLPSSSSNNVVTVLSQLNHWIRKSPSKEEMEPLLQCVKVAEEMRSDIVKEIRGGDIVRDQDMGDNVDEEPPDDFRKISIMPTAAEIKERRASVSSEEYHIRGLQIGGSLSRCAVQTTEGGFRLSAT